MAVFILKVRREGCLGHDAVHEFVIKGPNAYQALMDYSKVVQENAGDLIKETVIAINGEPV